MAESGAAVVDRLEREFPGVVRGRGEFRGQAWVEIAADRMLEIFEWLRDDPSTAFDFLVDVTAVHFPDEPAPMELVYHLESYPRNDRLRVKVRTGDTGPVPSIAELWRSADWNERETFDMFGIRFEGHPDLRRILMPDDYTDFPLRKELPLYRG